MTPIGIHYRIGRSADEETIVRVRAEALAALAPHCYSRAQVEVWGRLPFGADPSDGSVSVAEMDGRIIGYGWAESCQVKDLYVLPEHWGSSCGSALLQRLEQRLRPCLAIDLRATLAARAFYQQRGYEALGLVEILINAHHRASVIWRHTHPAGSLAQPTTMRTLAAIIA